MKNKLLLLLCLAGITSNCQNKTNGSIVSSNLNDLKCKELLKKYKEKFSTSDIDSTRYYIESAMKCAPENKSYINNSLQFYIKIADYEAAIKQVEKLKSDESDKSLDFMIAVIKLKLGDHSAKNDLKKIYLQFKSDKELTSSNLIYKIALDNYFSDINYVLSQLKEYRKFYKSGYDIQNMDAIEELVKSTNKEKVLFSLFNIKD